jgi:GNAT superfamily N-acetyltransferase
MNNPLFQCWKWTKRKDILIYKLLKDNEEVKKKTKKYFYDSKNMNKTNFDTQNRKTMDPFIHCINHVLPGFPKDYIHNIIKKKSTYICWCTVDNHISGLKNIIYTKNKKQILTGCMIYREETIQNFTFWEIVLFGVYPNFQYKGIGRFLLENIIDRTNIKEIFDKIQKNIEMNEEDDLFYKSISPMNFPEIMIYHSLLSSLEEDPYDTISQNEQVLELEKRINELKRQYNVIRKNFIHEKDMDRSLYQKKCISRYFYINRLIHIFNQLVKNQKAIPFYEDDRYSKTLYHKIKSIFDDIKNIYLVAKNRKNVKNALGRIFKMVQHIGDFESINIKKISKSIPFDKIHKMVLVYEKCLMERGLGVVSIKIEKQISNMEENKKMENMDYLFFLNSWYYGSNDQRKKLLEKIQKWKICYNNYFGYTHIIKNNNRVFFYIYMNLLIYIYNCTFCSYFYKYVIDKAMRGVMLNETKRILNSLHQGKYYGFVSFLCKLTI